MHMDSIDPLVAFKRELKKVQILGGTMSIVTSYKEYTEKVLSSKRDIDTTVEFGDYIIIGMFGAASDVASATFVSVPKGISVYPTDGEDIDSLVSISIERLSTLKIDPEIRWVWKTMKDFSPLEEQKSLEAGFISKPFYQFYAFLIANPQELRQFLSRMHGQEQGLVEDYLPYGVSSCRKDFISGEDKKPCNFIEKWGYQEKIQEKTTKGIETLRRFRNIEHLFTLPSIARQIIDTLHDLGKIAFFQRGEDIGSLDKASSLEELALEEMKTGLSHAEMGAYIVDRWNLPKDIVDGLMTHHIPHRSTHMPISIALHLADLIAHNGEIDIDSINSGAVRYMNEKGIKLISNDIVTKVYEDIKVKVKIVLEN